MSTRARIYLDYNATAPLSELARAAMASAMADVGNPSSVHAEGRRARHRVEQARDQVAALVGRPRDQIVFTSGGTEANALGVLALANVVESRGLPKVIATTTTEHPSLVGPIETLKARGWIVTSIDQAASVAAYALVNHEVGWIANVPRLGDTLIHVDAVQAAGKLPLDMDADSIAISGHKLGGPQGTGALAIRVDAGLPIVDGGHQERGRRPGTENTIGIAGFGAAAAAATLTDWPRVAELGDRLERGLLAIPGVRIHGAAMRRAGGTINAGFGGALGESIVIALDLAGIAASTGAACTSGSIEPSRVLLGLGMTVDQAREAVRFSLGRGTTTAEIDQVLAVLPNIVERARKHH